MRWGCTLALFAGEGALGVRCRGVIGDDAMPEWALDRMIGPHNCAYKRLRTSTFQLCLQVSVATAWHAIRPRPLGVVIGFAPLSYMI
eukprot:9501672-Pyramimonas_sp.AAC.1